MNGMTATHDNPAVANTSSIHILSYKAHVHTVKNAQVNTVWLCYNNTKVVNEFVIMRLWHQHKIILFILLKLTLE